VVTPNGEKSKVYFKPPAGLGTDLFFDNPPKAHLGQPITENSAKLLCELNITYLRSLVQKTLDRFGDH